MTVYTDPNTFLQDSKNKFLLKIDSTECKVLLEALKSFDKINAKNKPTTSSLKKAISQIDTALLKDNEVSKNGYVDFVKCEPCQD